MCAMAHVPLHEFIVENRDEIIRRCRAKVATRSMPPPTEAEIDHGVPLFLDQLVDALRLGLRSSPQIEKSAVRHGHDLLLQGFTVSQVVHDYGDVCQAVTELAVEMNAPIGTDDFRTLNRCLDDAIAGAVTEYGRERNQSTLDERVRTRKRAARVPGSRAAEPGQHRDARVRGAQEGEMSESPAAPAPCSIAACLAFARSWTARSPRSGSRRAFQNRERIPGLAIHRRARAGGNAGGEHQGASDSTVMPVEDGVIIEADRQVLAAVVGEPAAERLQVHAGHAPPSRCASAPAPSGCSSRSRTNAAACRRGTSTRLFRPFEAAQRRPHRRWSRSRIQPVGRRSERTAGSTRATCPDRMRLHRRSAAAYRCGGEVIHLATFEHMEPFTDPLRSQLRPLARHAQRHTGGSPQWLAC